jgi:hypothetical protein
MPSVRLTALRICGCYRDLQVWQLCGRTQSQTSSHNKQLAVRQSLPQTKLKAVAGRKGAAATAAPFPVDVAQAAIFKQWHMLQVQVQHKHDCCTTV